MTDQTGRPRAISQIGPRIGIDGFNLAIPRGTGVATYARSLSHCLRQLGHPIDALYGMSIAPGTPPAQRQIAFFEQLETERGWKRPPYPSIRWARVMAQAWRGATALPIPIDGGVDPRAMAHRLPAFDRIWNHDALFSQSAQFFRTFHRFMPIRIPDPPAIMHWTYPVPVRLEGARNVYTLHDLVPLRLPFATLDHKPTYQALVAHILRHADHVCTVSECSRNDVLALFPGTDPARITNTYQAVAPGPVPDPASRLLQDGFGLEPGRYLLFFGSIEPKKNVLRLLQGFLAAGIPIPLVVVSARSWGAGPEGELLRSATAGGRVRHIEYVPQDLLATLVHGARAVAFPSLYEGFGLPVLEAMQLGTPVLTTREGSLPEVAGDAAEYVDAYDPASIGAGLHRLATDDARCATLRALGPVQAARFSMDAFAGRMRAVYDQMLAGAG